MTYTSKQIENAKKTANEIEKKLAEIKRKLKQKEKFDFQLKTEAREQLRNQEDLFNEIDDLSEKIKNKIDELEKQIGKINMNKKTISPNGICLRFPAFCC